MTYSEKRTNFRGPWRLEAVLDRHRPEAARAIGQIISAWAQLEVQEAILFGHLIGAENQSAAVLALQNVHSGGKRRAIITEASAHLPEDATAYLSAINVPISELAIHRNRLAHDPLGIALDEFPEDVIWIPSKMVPRPALPAMRRFIQGDADRQQEEMTPHIEFYSLGSLRLLADAILDVHFQLIGFMFWLLADPGDFKNQCLLDFVNGPRPRDWKVGVGEVQLQ